MNTKRNRKDCKMRLIIKNERNLAIVPCRMNRRKRRKNSKLLSVSRKIWRLARKVLPPIPELQNDENLTKNAKNSLLKSLIFLLVNESILSQLRCSKIHRRDN